MIYLGDYREKINEKADLILTSPPYNIGSSSPAKTGKRNAKLGLYDPKSYRGIREYPDSMQEEDYQRSQVEFMKWAYRHLKKDGILAYNHKPRRRGKIIHPMEWILKVPELHLMEEIIWDRKSTHNHCNKMVWNHTERIFIFKKDIGKYKFKNKKDLPFRSDIWSVPRSSVNGHNAPFPELLVRAIIVGWSNPGDLVIDPYLGSGTTAMVAREMGRKFVGSEIMKKYYNMTMENIINGIV